MLPMILMMSGIADGPSFAADDVHHLAFASDYHWQEGSIEHALKSMPDDTEYVSLLGDMVGAGKGDAPAYNSSEILDRVKEVFPNLTKDNTSIVWGDHDYGVNDDAQIVKGKDGYGSGLIYEGKNKDGSTAYYVYGVAQFEMTDGGKNSENAAAAFKKWVDGVSNKDIPIFVLSHVPIQAMLGDNNGAMYWNEALNYAATGREGIISTNQTGTISRRVLFLHGHNHTMDQTEYYYKSGETMPVQVDASANADKYGNDTLVKNGIKVTEKSGTDEERGAVKARNVESNIYYTSLTAGYLNSSGSGTLVTIKDGSITLNRYSGDEQVNVGKDADGKEVGKEVVISRLKRSMSSEYAAVNVTKTDENGKTLSGAEFTLYDANGKKITTYDKEVFSINTAESMMAAYLPEAGKSVTLKLKETKAPSGYKLDSKEHSVVISNTVTESLKGDNYVQMVSYTITIDGKTSISIANSKTSGAQNNTNKSSSKSVGNVPKTGDESPISTYTVTASIAAILLAGIAVWIRRRNV